MNNNTNNIDTNTNTNTKLTTNYINATNTTNNNKLMMRDERPLGLVDDVELALEGAVLELAERQLRCPWVALPV